MVFYFTSSEGITMYMGKDKFENEDLLRYGFTEDVWFHVDNLSSAHVYLRLPQDKCSLDDISPQALEECSQLVKENSIEGCKKKTVTVVYTPYENLRKTQSMEVGQVGFHDESKVRKYVVQEKNKDMLKALNKTKQELYPDLEEEKRRREQKIKAQRKAHRVAQQAEAKRLAEERKKEMEMRSYSSVFQEEKMKSNKEHRATADASAAVDYEEDFM